MKDPPTSIVSVCEIECPEQWAALPDMDAWALDELTSEFKEARFEGFAHLFQVTEAPDRVRAVPCLLAGLRHNCFPDIDGVLHVLGTWAFEDPFMFWPDLNPDAADYPAALLELEAALRAELSKGTGVLFDLLRAQDADTQQGAAYVLGRCATVKASLIPQIQELIGQEQEIRMQAELLLALGVLAAGDAAEADFPMEYVDSNSPAVRVAAIAATLLILGPNTPAPVLWSLVEVARDPGEFDAPGFDWLFGSLHSGWPTPLGLLERVLPLFDAAVRAQSVLKLTEILTDSRFDRPWTFPGSYRERAVQSILRQLFPSGEFPQDLSAKSMSPTQLAVLHRIADAEALWPDHREGPPVLYFGDTVEGVFGMEGFPESPQALRQRLSN
jgi:hypothetical protein